MWKNARMGVVRAGGSSCYCKTLDVDGHAVIGSALGSKAGDDMIQALKLYSADYSRQILEMQGVRPAKLPAGLMQQLSIETELSPTCRVPRFSGSTPMPSG